MTFDIKEFLIENRAPLNEADPITDTKAAFIGANISATLTDALRQTNKAQHLITMLPFADRGKLGDTVQQITDIINKARRQIKRLGKS